jgi:TonB family protein
MLKPAALAASLLACALALTGGAPAHADITSFNAAMVAKDYKTAAADAVSTWPTLDKSRSDLPIIAREFGFAAYLAGDFAAARMFGEAAAASGAVLGEADVLRTASDVLRDLAIHRLGPSAATRDKLVATLGARAAMPGMDLISYCAADVSTAYDFERGAWREAEVSAGLGERLTGAGGSLYHVYSLRFDLFENVAEYMHARDVKSYAQLESLRERTIAAINAAASDNDARSMVDFYWEVEAWRVSVGTHLVSRRKMKWPEGPEDADRQPEQRAVRLLGLRTSEDACVSRVDMRREVNYPSSALYKGLIGVVILRVDIDASGAASNAEILTAVPGKHFGDAVLKSVKDIRYKPTKDWAPGCSLVQNGRVVTFQFMVS